jgi:two-component system response regulator DevR
VTFPWGVTLNTSLITTAPVRVLVVDGWEVYRRGVVQSLVHDDTVDVVGEAGTVAEADVLVRSLQPDVVLLDARLPDGSGVELCRRFQATAPATHWLFLTSDGVGMVGAADAGAIGHLSKDVHRVELVAAVLRAASGGSWDPVCGGVHTVAEVVTALEVAVASLTGRESAVLRLITEGMTNRQIGAELVLSEKTVKNYVSLVLSKLGVARRTQAAVLGADARQLLLATAG